MNQVIKRDFIESASSLRSCDWATVHIGVYWTNDVSPKRDSVE